MVLEECVLHCEEVVFLELPAEVSPLLKQIQNETAGVPAKLKRVYYTQAKHHVTAAESAHLKEKALHIQDPPVSAATTTCAETTPTQSIASQPRGTKPWFVKKLPSRVEVLESQNFGIYCHVQSACKPWFVKKLPQKLSINRGETMEFKCHATHVSQESLNSLSSAASRHSLTSLQSLKSVDEPAVKKVKKLETPEKPPPKKPLAPRTLRVSHMTDSSVTIEWDRPEHQGAAPITHYVLEKREAGRQWEALTTLPPSVTECELENMAANREYFVRMRAQNKHGLSEPAELAAPIVMKGVSRNVPSKPGRPDVQVEEDKATLTWAEPLSSGGCPVTKYIVERRETRGPRWVRVQKLSTTACPFEVRPLLEGVEYQFRVTAQNAEGLSEPSEMSHTVVCKQPDVEPPKFTHTPRDVTCEEGDTAHFECHVTGSPQPEMRWYKNYREVFDGYKHSIRQDGGRCQLTVSSVCADDVGQVECRAHNKAGNASVQAKLTLQSPAKIKVAPKLYEGLSFIKGKMIKIKIPVIGRPFPKITWDKDGEVLEPSDRVSIGTKDGCVTLLVHGPEKGDAGLYCIKVENSSGFDEFKFPVAIVDRPEPPTSAPTISDVTEDSLRLQWAPPAGDGGAPVTCYFVERKEQGGWSKCGYTHLTSMIVHNLKHNTHYTFRVSAENVHGLSEAGPEVEHWTEVRQKTGIDYDKLVTSERVLETMAISDVSTCDVGSKYIICEELGRAEHAVVYRAIERSTGQNWAALYARPPQGHQTAPLQRERDVTGGLQHPRLLRRKESFERPGETVHIYELLSGTSVAQRLKSDGVSESVAASIIRQVCEGLDYLHKHDVVLLNLKTDNVVFTRSCSDDVKLMDLTFAHTLDPAGKARLRCAAFDHCAPEVVAGRRATTASDMWSLGVLAYTLLCGRSPFLCSTPDATRQKIMRCNSQNIFHEKDLEKLSCSAQDFVQSLLNVDAKKRPAAKAVLKNSWLQTQSVEKTTIESTIPNRAKTSHVWNTDNESILTIGTLASQCAFSQQFQNDSIQMDVPMGLMEAAPEVLQELGNSDAVEGAAGRFKCKFSGHPEPTVLWYHEDQRLEAGPKYEMWLKRGLAMLNVTGAQPEDAGVYTAVAVNTGGQCATIGELSVQPLGWRRRQSVESSSVFSAFSSRRGSTDLSSLSSGSFRRQSVDVSALRKIEAQTQSGVGRRNSVVMLHTGGSRRGSLIGADSDVTPTSSGRRGSVLGPAGGGPESLHAVVTSLDQNSRRGSLGGRRDSLCSRRSSVCSVASSVDSVTGGYNVQRRHRSRSVSADPAGTAAPRSAPPEIRLPLMDVMLPMGEITVMSCEVLGHPDPTVEWFHNNELVEDCAKYQIQKQGDIYRCIIYNSMPTDSGRWKVVASNAEGRSKTKCSLTILDDVPLDYTVPEFPLLLYPRAVKEGQSVRMDVRVQAWPDPALQWFHNRRQIRDCPQYRIVQQGAEFCSLLIERVEPEDDGWYMVRAINCAGTASTEAELVVKRKSRDERRREEERRRERQARRRSRSRSTEHSE